MWLGCQALSYLLVQISTVANATSQDKNKLVKGKSPLLRAATQGWCICGWINLFNFRVAFADVGIKTTLDDYHEQPGVQILFFLPSLLDHLYPEKMEKKKKSRKILFFVWLKYIVSLDLHRNHSREKGQDVSILVS